MPINFDKMCKKRGTAQGYNKAPATRYGFGKVGGYLNIRAGTYGYLGVPPTSYSLEGFTRDIFGVDTVAKITASRFNRSNQNPAISPLKVHDSRDIFTSHPLQIADLLATIDAPPMSGEMHIALEFCEHAVGLSLVKVGNHLTIVYSDLSGFDYGVGRQVNAGITGRATQAVEFATSFFGSDNERNWGLAYTFNIQDDAHIAAAQQLLTAVHEACNLPRPPRTPGEAAEGTARRLQEHLHNQQTRMQTAFRDLAAYRDSPLSIILRDDVQQSGCCAYQNMNAILQLHLANQHLRKNPQETLEQAISNTRRIYDEIRKQEMLEALCDLIRWTKANPATEGGVGSDVLAGVINQLLAQRGGLQERRDLLWANGQELLLGIYESNSDSFDVLSEMIMYSIPVRLGECRLMLDDISIAKKEIFRLSFEDLVPESDRGALNPTQFQNDTYLINNIDNIVNTLLSSDALCKIYINYEPGFKIPLFYDGTINSSLAVVRQTYAKLHPGDDRNPILNLQLDLMVILRLRAFEIERKSEDSKTSEETAHLVQLLGTLHTLKTNRYVAAADLALQLRELYLQGHTGKFTAKIPQRLLTTFKRENPRTKTAIIITFQNAGVNIEDLLTPALTTVSEPATRLSAKR